jgi:hypothetical protein
VHRAARARRAGACGEHDIGTCYTTNEAQVSCTRCRLATSPYAWLEFERCGTLQMAESILTDLTTWFGYLAAYDGSAASALTWMAFTRWRRSRQAAWPLAAAGMSAYVREVFLADPEILRASAGVLQMQLRDTAERPGAPAARLDKDRFL